MAHSIISKKTATALDSEEHAILLRTYILGLDSSGKTALAVRHLTQRFIYEYATTEGRYHRLCRVDNSVVNLFLYDLSDREYEQTDLDTIVDNADVVIIVYSITSNTSFSRAKELVEAFLGQQQQQRECSGAASTTDKTKASLRRNMFKNAHKRVTFALFANKSDMEHLRAVDTRSAERLVHSYGLLHQSTSAFADPVSVCAAFNACFADQLKRGRHTPRPFSDSFGDSARIVDVPTIILTQQDSPSYSSSSSSSTSAAAAAGYHSCNTGNHSIPITADANVNSHSARGGNHGKRRITNLFNNMRK